MIHLKLYELIIERNKSNHLSLADAPFFHIEKDGRSAYMLGTCHVLDLSFLPEFVLERIKESDQLFTENGAMQALGLKQLMISMLYVIHNKSEQFEWHTILNHEEIECLRQAVYDSYDNTLEEHQLSFDLLELSPEFVFQTVVGLISSEYAAQINNLPIPMMDCELEEMFGSSVLALEPKVKWVGDVSNDLLSQENIEILQKKLIPFLQSYKKYYELTQTKQTELLESVADLVFLHTPEQSSKYYSESCDFRFAIEIDALIANDMFGCSIRNMIMFNNIEASLGKYKKPLYAIGAGHIFGGLGLINLMSSKGYTVSKVTPQGLEPIQYQYNQYIRSYNAIKREILGGKNKSCLLWMQY